MNYEQALQYIHSVSWMGSRPGLSRTRELLRRMGDPQEQLKFVHVAGTNGKGSTCAMTASILQAAGYRVGLYTSPYIVRFNERMRVDGADIDDAELAEITAYVKPFAEGMDEHPTEFELVTAIGFEYFRRHRCDVVVLEVGLGGELDSTNVIAPPLVSVITEIDFDHMGVLGNSIAEIASAKAGIIKAGSPVVSADNLPESAAVIARVCRERGCAHITPAYDEVSAQGYDGQGICFSLGGVAYRVPLFGKYQYRNAVMAITVARLLNDRGLAVSEQAIVEGLRTVSWRGRFEKLSDAPLFIYDGGHNPQGVTAAANSYRALYGEARAVVLIGVMADKDYAQEIDTLLPIAGRFVTVRPDNPRALSAQALADKIVAQGGIAEAASTVEEGVRMAVETAAGEVPVLALGSLYMYGEIRAAFDKLYGAAQ